MDPSEYKYDLFLSYKRNNLISPWITNHFLAIFEDWLTEKLLALNESRPRIFFDQREIEPGGPWPKDLQMALKTSKILLAVCSPSYFSSKWCMSEWESFVQRQSILGINGLIIPIRHNDCENYLQDIQWSDFYGYTFLAKEFYQSSQAIAFEKKIETLAGLVAQVIQNAPPFQPAWPASSVQPEVQANISMRRL
jgi:TIR domain